MCHCTSVWQVLSQDRQVENTTEILELFSFLGLNHLESMYYTSFLNDF